MQKKRIGSLRAAAALSILVLFACASTGEAQGRCPTNKIPSKLLLLQKLVGGRRAPWGRYPYMVSLRTRQSKQHICGGTLIAKDLVLTAAHCVHEDDPDAVPLPFLRIGGTDMDDDPDAEEIDACRTFLHKKYDSSNILKPYDLALIQLKEDSSKQPCKLGTATSGEVTAVGWGLNDRGVRATVARELELSVVGLDQCRKKLPEYEFLLDSQMCAVNDQGDVCGGDSGGPLVHLGNGCGEDDLLWGVVSGGAACFDESRIRSRRRGIPGFYSRVSAFDGWINSLSPEDFILYRNPTCNRPPPQQMMLGKEEGPQITTDAGVPDLSDEEGCFFVEGIDFAKGIVPINNGKEDVKATPEECCDLCKSTPGCRAWTYFRVKEKYSPKGACWLRSIVPPPTRCTVCTSGLVKPDLLNAPEESCDIVLGMDFKGADLYHYKASKVQDCCTMCKGNPRCSFFTYSTSTKNCYLKNGIGKLQICSACQSGILLERVGALDDVEIILSLVQGMEKTMHALKQTTIPGPCRLSIGMDLAGGKLINGGNVPIAGSPEECCSLCKAQKGCRSWTMITVPTSLREIPGQCYMRSNVPEEVPCAACTSGVVDGQGASGVSSPNCGLLEGVAFEKEDLDIPVRITAGPKECCDLCKTTTGCKSWTRTKTDGKCFLKNVALPEIKLCSGCDSGINIDKVTASEVASLAAVFSKD